MPTPLAWYAAQLPPWLLAAGTTATLVVEIGCVFLIFLPRRPRALAGCALLLFQGLILLTGNYNFFNVLSMTMCIFLFDDAALGRLLPRWITAWAQARAPHPGRLATTVATVLALVVVPVGVNRISQAVMRTDLPVLGALSRAVSPLLIVNAYGLFAVMTTTRPEIVIEGSADGQTWVEYGFPYKPGKLTRAPFWNVPHQPRLDWQMWFAALGDAQANPWFQNLVFRLLQGSPPVLALLEAKPVSLIARRATFAPSSTYTASPIHARTRRPVSGGRVSSRDRIFRRSAWPTSSSPRTAKRQRNRIKEPRKTNLMP